MPADARNVAEQHPTRLPTETDHDGITDTSSVQEQPPRRAAKLTGMNGDCSDLDVSNEVGVEERSITPLEVLDDWDPPPKKDKKEKKKKHPSASLWESKML